MRRVYLDIHFDAIKSQVVSYETPWMIVNLSFLFSEVGTGQNNLEVVLQLCFMVNTLFLLKK